MTLEKKPDKENNDKAKPAKKCQTSIQLKFLNLPETLLGQNLICTLGEQSQEKTLDAEEAETDIAFKFDYKGDKKVKVVNIVGKGKPTVEEVYCPQANETLTGNLATEDQTFNQPISVTVVKTKGGKPTKVTYDLGSV